MFLGRYDFAGDPAELATRYDAMLAQIPPDNIGFHACVTHAGGLTIYDTCPTAEVFAGFSTSGGFRELVRAVGLPEPVVTPLGEVHAALAGTNRLV